MWLLIKALTPRQGLIRLFTFSSVNTSSDDFINMATCGTLKKDVMK